MEEELRQAIAALLDRIQDLETRVNTLESKSDDWYSSSYDC